MTTVTAKTLYDALKPLGLSRGQARQLLPVWWTADIEATPTGVAELAMNLGRRLSIDVSELMAGRVAPRGAVEQVAFKHLAKVDVNSLSAATFIASSLAQSTLAAMRLPYVPLPTSAELVREEARELGDGIASFKSLLVLCWNHGIPVIPLPHLPVGIRKMDGAALRIGERPAIIVARRNSSRAWLSFILAHEIAHIVQGHLGPGSSIVDVSLQDMATYATESSQDRLESEADGLALDLLGGNDAISITANWPRSWSPVEIAVAARESAPSIGAEAGHLVLRHAFSTRRWPEAITALRFLREDLDPQGELTIQLKAHLELDRIAEDLQDMVAQITGWNVDPVDQ